MLKEVDTQIFTITDTAAQAVKDILAERKLEGYALRVFVSGGGCCGVNFGMALDNNFREVDTTFEAHGIRLVVDNVSIDYLQGAKVDFVNDPQHGAGFLVDSPNAKHSHDHGDEGCACGGSCSCNS
jgi:iron-sulfur cluster assembly accessory protein